MSKVTKEALQAELKSIREQLAKHCATINKIDSELHTLQIQKDVVTERIDKYHEIESDIYELLKFGSFD